MVGKILRAWTTLCIPHQSTFRNERSPRTSPDQNWRSEDHPWSCNWRNLYNWVGWRANEDQTRWSVVWIRGREQWYRSFIVQSILHSGSLWIAHSKCPAELKDCGPLYLSPLRKERQWSKSPVWFSKASIGVHSIDNFVNRMAVAAGLDVTKKHYTNHSIRKITVKKLVWVQQRSWQSLATRISRA